MHPNDTPEERSRHEEMPPEAQMADAQAPDDSVGEPRSVSEGTSIEEAVTRMQVPRDERQQEALERSGRSRHAPNVRRALEIHP